MSATREGGRTHDDHQQSVRRWLEEHASELDRFRHVSESDLESSEKAFDPFVTMLFEAGWLRWGWPIEHGGLGGTEVHRAIVYDEITRARLPIPERLYAAETLAPSLVEYAPALATTYLTALMSGEEIWCQGFSEPGAGSDLAALTTKAVRDGDEWVVSGQKIWTTFGHLASRCALLVRTGAPDSRHRGLTMLLVDLDSSGVTTRPIAASSGRNEFAEMFFDEVRVPVERQIGAESQGWEVAMHLLQYERGMYAWMRQCTLQDRLRSLVAQLDGSRSETTQARIGQAYLAVNALRGRSASTIRDLASGGIGSGGSIDKLLLARAEQDVTDAARDLLGTAFLFDAAPAYRHWRTEWFYTRASSIYGGAAEVQRNIVAQRVLGLPRSTA